MATRPEAVLKKAEELSRAKKPRSLSRWFERHYDTLAGGFRAMAPEKPDWEAMVLALAEEGIKRADGTPIKAPTAQRAWNRVQVRMRKRRALKPPAPPTKPGEIAPGVRKVAQPEPVAEAESEDEPPAQEFGFASEKKWTKEGG